ncbi:MAG: hypothetical protein WCW33_05035 [Candidatus Babeliales bacterium]|jgi:hypothetical protein
MMKITKALILVVGALATSPMLFAMKKAIVLDSCPYPKMAGETALVQGTVQEVFGIENFWDSEKALRIMPLVKYTLALPPELLGDNGIIYYAKVGGLEYCFHESWLKMIPDEDEYAEEKEVK